MNLKLRYKLEKKHIILNALSRLRRNDELIDNSSKLNKIDIFHSQVNVLIRAHAIVIEQIVYSIIAIEENLLVTLL